jgi:hypothetical protein
MCNLCSANEDKPNQTGYLQVYVGKRVVYLGISRIFSLVSNDLSSEFFLTWLRNGEYILTNFMFCWRCVSIYACNETNLMHYLSSVYSVTIPLHVSGLLVAHHQEVTIYIYIHRVIHKSLRNLRTRLRNNQDRHSRKEHINTCKVGQKLGVSVPLLTCFPSAWPSRLVYRRGRKSRRDLWISRYIYRLYIYICNKLYVLYVLVDCQLTEDK